jgi:hypothetical protein
MAPDLTQGILKNLRAGEEPTQAQRHAFFELIGVVRRDAAERGELRRLSFGEQLELVEKYGGTLERA